MDNEQWMKPKIPSHHPADRGDDSSSQAPLSTSVFELKWFKRTMLFSFSICPVQTCLLERSSKHLLPLLLAFLFSVWSATPEEIRNPSSAPFPFNCITCHANAPNPAGQRTRVQLQMTVCGRRAFDDLGTDHAESPDPVYIIGSLTGQAGAMKPI